MKTRLLFATFFGSLILAVPHAWADELDISIVRLQQAGRNDIIDATLSPYSVTRQNLPSITDPELRKKLAGELQDRSTLLEISLRQWGDYGANLDSRANALILAPDLETRLNRDPLLKMSVVQKSMGREFNYQMSFPEGRVLPNGSVAPIVFVPSLGLTAPDPAQLAALPAYNKYPDIAQLPFGMSFLAEVIARGARCSGAFLNPKLVLTARHCVLDQEGRVLPARELSVHALNGNSSTGSSVWTLEIGVGEPRDNAFFRDIATIVLDSDVAGTTSAKVVPAETQTLWVIFAGHGITNLDPAQPALVPSPAPAFLARQYVRFSRRTNFPATAAIKWQNSDDLPSSQCAGDSGGPVVVEGRGNEPVIVGILSHVQGPNPNTKTRCDSTREGAFIDLGHLYVRRPMCDALENLGAACLGETAIASR